MKTRQKINRFFFFLQSHWVPYLNFRCQESSEILYLKIYVQNMYAHMNTNGHVHTFHSNDQINFVRFLPSAFQNSLTPSSALGFPAQTPTFLLASKTHTSSHQNFRTLLSM